MSTRPLELEPGVDGVLGWSTLTRAGAFGPGCLRSFQSCSVGESAVPHFRAHSTTALPLLLNKYSVPLHLPSAAKSCAIYGAVLNPPGALAALRVALGHDAFTNLYDTCIPLARPRGVDAPKASVLLYLPGLQADSPLQLSPLTSTTSQVARSLCWS